VAIYYESIYMKVFIGIAEIAGNIREFSHALIQAGYNVTTFSIYDKNTSFEKNKYSYLINFPAFIDKHRILRAFYLQSVLLYYFIRNFNKFDVYFFIWSKTFLPFKVDLFLLKLIGKEVIVANCGSDVRYRYIQEKIDREIYAVTRFDSGDRLKYIAESNGFFRTFFNQKIEEWSGSKIISTSEQATFQRKKYFHFSLSTQRLMDYSKRPREVPKILHCPSNNLIKGTKHVVEAVNLLKNEGLKFDFELIQGKTNEYVLERLIRADIVIDQPAMWVGKLAVEGLSAGCVVVGGNNQAYMKRIELLPVIQFEPDGRKLASILRILIKDKVMRQELMEKSYFAWEKYYSPQAFAIFFKAVLDGSALTFSPLENHKQILLDFAENRLQRLLIKLLY
jgi:hypothetical protein